FEKADAYDQYVRSYRAVKIPGKYTGDSRVEVEKQIKEIDASLVQPLENKSQEILKLCVDKAAQFHVVGEYVAKCRERIKKAEAEAEPSGLLPQPSYWSTRWVGGAGEVAKREN